MGRGVGDGCGVGGGVGRDDRLELNRLLKDYSAGASRVSGGGYALQGARLMQGPARGGDYVLSRPFTCNREVLDPPRWVLRHNNALKPNSPCFKLSFRNGDRPPSALSALAHITNLLHCSPLHRHLPLNLHSDLSSTFHVVVVRTRLPESRSDPQPWSAEPFRRNRSCAKCGWRPDGRHLRPSSVTSVTSPRTEHTTSTQTQQILGLDSISSGSDGI